MWIDVLNIFFVLCLLLFAYFNLNDGDSWLWVPIYTIPAVLCGLAVFDQHFPLVYLLLGIAYSCYALRLFFVKDGVYAWMTTYSRPSIVESMQAKKPYIEITREFFGLLIVILILVFNYVIASDFCN